MGSETEEWLRTSIKALRTRAEKAEAEVLRLEEANSDLAAESYGNLELYEDAQAQVVALAEALASTIETARLAVKAEQSLAGHIEGVTERLDAERAVIDAASAALSNTAQTAACHDRRVLERAAELIERYSINNSANGPELTPRHDGDVFGIFYATAIRALADRDGRAGDDGHRTFAQTMQPGWKPPGWEHGIGTRLTKVKGSNWTGPVVGFYRGSLTEFGYAVESENEPGNVQIYPVQAFAIADREDGG
ncbi:hypothetical protein [Oceaniradius stylonematis]|uniref:hypothetical protein n=1 Tax=Oceaniradius stylonematis TaxID=2184161 RepID=UPI00273E55B7|nr:hypothetical protein [Oceaniradius stylonematis]